MEKVSIIGSGSVGVATAFYLAEKFVANVMLIDNVEGKAKGNALDLAEASPLREYEISINGSSDYKDIKGSKVVVIAAGAVRQPNTIRLELLEENMAVADSIVEEIKTYAPKAVIVVLTEPVSTLTYYIWKKSGLPRTKVMGVSGKLDTSRVCELVARELGVAPQDVSALVLGGHHEYMIIPPEYIRVCGIPVTELLPADSIKRILSKTRSAGTEILSLLKKQTSMYSPGASAAEMVEAIIRDTKAIMCVPTCLDGEYDYKDICLGVPVVLGSKGIEKIIQVDLSIESIQDLRVSAEIIKRAIESTGVRR